MATTKSIGVLTLADTNIHKPNIDYNSRRLTRERNTHEELTKNKEFSKTQLDYLAQKHQECTFKPKINWSQWHTEVSLPEKTYRSLKNKE